jgi:hypothetical protein
VWGQRRGVRPLVGLGIVPFGFLTVTAALVARYHRCLRTIPTGRPWTDEEELQPSNEADIKLSNGGMNVVLELGGMSWEIPHCNSYHIEKKIDIKREEN